MSENERPTCASLRRGSRKRVAMLYTEEILRPNNPKLKIFNN
jgi:hypothetical protein